MRGRFITFEGLDGSGKTTQIDKLARRLRRAGVKVVVAREPGGTKIGNAVRRILLDARTRGMMPATEMLLYFSARAQNAGEVVLPALRSGAVVLCDRWTDSTEAYQGHGRKLGSAAVADLDRIACLGLRPDHTILLDVAYKAGVARSLQHNRSRLRRGGRDESRIEREGRAFFERVRRAYRAIVRREPQRVQVVNGDRSIEEIHREIWDLTASWGIRKR